MELGTFGAVLSFAIDLEGRGLAFYTQAANASEGEHRAVFEELARAKSKRKQIVERTRRENVAEMILESVSGLEGDDYQVDMDLEAQRRPQEMVRQGITNEETAQSFYAAASGRIGIGEVARIFQKLAKENAGHKFRLESLSQ